MQAGSNDETLSHHDRASGLQSLMSPVVAGVVLENNQHRAGDFAVAMPSIVLCADLSGTSIAGATLTRSEARGAEELRGIVNAVFGCVTDPASRQVCMAYARRATGSRITPDGNAVLSIDGERSGNPYLCGVSRTLDFFADQVLTFFISAAVCVLTSIRPF